MSRNKILWIALMAVFLGLSIFLIILLKGRMGGEVKTGGPQEVDKGVEESGEEEEGILEEIKLFSKALGVINQAYPEDMNVRNLLYDAVRGMMNSLDRYSEFIGPERYKVLQIYMRGEYAGIGVVLQMLGNVPGVKGVKPDSAAEQAGLEPFDKILKINGEITQGLDLSAVASRLRGEEKTSLVLTIQRDRIRKIFDVEIVREKIEIESARDMRMVGRAVGYILLSGWQSNTIDQVDEGVAQLQEQGMEALIIDLRNNDGGLLPQAVALAERFLPKDKKIVSVDSKVEEQRKEYLSSGKHVVQDFPIVILVNANSASASEIFSAAMQDHKRGTVIGEKTFGKAAVQSVIPLDDVSAMKLTTARYLSPLGRNINDVGIIPDEVVENAPPGTPNADRQIQRALEVLREYV